MNYEKRIDLNDPKLTAFALGELEGQEAIEMAKQIENASEARKFVEEVQQTAEILKLELEKESVPSNVRLAPSEREKIFAGVPSSATGLSAEKAWWKRWTFALPTAALTSLAVAVLIVVMNRSVLDEKLPALSGDTATNISPDSSADAGNIARSEPPAPPQDLTKPEAAKSSQIAQDKTIVTGAADGELALSDEAPTEASDVAMNMEMEEAPAALSAPAPAPAARMQPGSSGYGLGGAVGYGRGAPMALKKGKFVEGGSSKSMPAEKEFNTERYSNIAENSWVRVSDEALSTFSIDVDTASYANVRRFLTSGQLPPTDAVRIEEMINYFKYEYPQPTDGRPFSVTTESAAAPWAPKHKLVRIGLKGKEVADAARPASNLVFLLDVSGSMEEPNKLPLVQKSMKLLVDKMREKDHVAIVVYAGNEAVVLDSTSGAQKKKIETAIDQLMAGGGTNGAGGIQKAYELAQKGFIKGGINRIVLATDGDFNVGTTSESELIKLVEEKAKTGVYLTVLGFGTGNYNDSMMVKLADKGNGNHAYIDSLREAQKVLVEQAGGTLMTIAKDVKIQVEFNPRYVSSYRLIGYEKRMLNKEDFNDDKKDAGEIGAGHTVTALYEIVPVGEKIPNDVPKVDELKYQQKTSGTAGATAPGASDELLTVKLRYKKPTSDSSEKFDVTVKNEDKKFDQASTDMKFAAAVAGFGMILRDSKHKGDFNIDQVIDLAMSNAKVAGKVDDNRLDLLDLARRTRELKKSK